MTPAQEAMYAFWTEWFNQPIEEKLKHRRDRKTNTGFYYPPGSESPGYEAKADPKEYVHLKVEQHLFRGTDFYESTREVFDQCLYKAWEWCSEQGLEQQLNAIVRPEDCVLRIIKYPATADGNVGQAHCDYDLITVSVPSAVPGLEVFEVEESRGQDDWEDTVSPDVYSGNWKPREAFEVHVGEMLSIYTRHLACNGVMGQIPATPHRVRTPPNTERLKAVFFYLPPMDFELKPGFTAHDYLLGPNGVLIKAGAGVRR